MLLDLLLLPDLSSFILGSVEGCLGPVSRSGGKEIVRGIKSGDRLAVFSGIPREKKGKVTDVVRCHSGLKESSFPVERSGLNYVRVG